MDTLHNVYLDIVYAADVNLY